MKDCKKGYSRNLVTNRCRKDCDKNQIRTSTGKCLLKSSVDKKSVKKLLKKPCKNTIKIRSKITGRCVFKKEDLGKSKKKKSRKSKSKPRKSKSKSKSKSRRNLKSKSKSKTRRKYKNKSKRTSKRTSKKTLKRKTSRNSYPPYKTFDGLRTFTFINGNKIDGFVDTNNDGDYFEMIKYWKSHYNKEFSDSIVNKLAKKFRIHQFWIEDGINRMPRTWEELSDWYADYGFTKTDGTNLDIGHIKYTKNAQFQR